MNPHSTELPKGSGYRDGIYYSKLPPLPIPEDPNLNWAEYTLDQPHMDRVAVVDATTGESMTFRELNRSVKSVAAGLAGLGIRQGDVALILCANSVHFPVLVFAVCAIGATVTTLNPLSTGYEIAKQTQDSHAKIMFTDSGLEDKVAGLRIPVVLVDKQGARGGAPSAAPVAFLSELYKMDPARAPKVKVRQTDTAILLYSSGTTGLSKGVKISHGNAIAAAALSAVPSSLAGDVQQRTICVIPFFHVFGMILLLGIQLRAGSQLVILPKFEMRDFLATIEKHKITSVALVPPIMVAMLKSPLLDQYDLSSVQLIGVGAAAVGVEVLDACAKRFQNAVVRQGFGMTETTGMGSTVPLVASDTAPRGTVGVLGPKLEAKIVDLETQQPLPPTRPGELWLRGPTVMQGYLNNQKSTTDTLDKDGWLHTGDVGYFDEEGWMFIVERIKELIKYNGFQIAPAELEAILLSHDKIEDAAVAGFPDEKSGQIPVAFIVTREGCTLSDDDVKAFVTEKVTPYKKVRRVVFVKKIPKTPSGKILRRELKLPQLSKL